MGYYEIKRTVIERYKTQFEDVIEGSINMMINRNFLLYKGGYQLSISFFLDDIVYIRIKHNEIVDVLRGQYEMFVTDEFLKQLLNEVTLTVEVERYRNLGLSRLRKYIQEELEQGRIVVRNNRILWDRLGIELGINDKNELVLKG